MFASRVPALAGCLAICISLLTPARAADTSPESAAARGRLIVAQRCANCHGADGTGAATAAYPRLAGQHPEYLNTQLVNFKTGSRTSLTMTEISATLGPDEIRDVVAYLASVPAPQSRARSVPSPVGERLFTRGDPASGVPACQSCHGPRGAGVAAAGIPRVAGQPALYLWAELEAFKSAERGADAGNVMRTVAARLSEQDMQALAHYISGLN